MKTEMNGLYFFETVVSVEIAAAGSGTRLHLEHAGFADADSRDRHQQAWPHVLAQLDQRVLGK